MAGYSAFKVMSQPINLARYLIEKREAERRQTKYANIEEQPRRLIH